MSSGSTVASFLLSLRYSSRSETAACQKRGVGCTDRMTTACASQVIGSSRNYEHNKGEVTTTSNNGLSLQIILLSPIELFNRLQITSTALIDLTHESNYTMSRERPLHGGCACGRNEYIIEMPPNAAERAQVIFDRGFGGGTIYRTSPADLVPFLSRLPNMPRPFIHHSQNMSRADSHLNSTHPLLPPLSLAPRPINLVPLNHLLLL